MGKRRNVSPFWAVIIIAAVCAAGFAAVYAARHDADKDVLQADFNAKTAEALKRADR